MLYRIIYADPPWQYADQKGNDPAMGGITYNTMSLDKIKSLPIASLVDTDCSLFLWVTMPMLREGLEVIKAWGFNYTTCAFTWVKLNSSNMGIYSGMGHWTNGNAELCLFAKKGSPKRLAKDIKQICLAPVLGHSHKPPEIRERIIRLMGDLPRIELFARKKVEGWDCVGNDIDGVDIREALNRITQVNVEKQEEFIYWDGLPKNP